MICNRDVIEYRDKSLEFPGSWLAIIPYLLQLGFEINVNFNNYNNNEFNAR